MPPVGNERYVNREFSWLQFNQRVLAEAARESNPLLERGKFLAIFESNLDEFYMVRVSGLIEQEAAKMPTITPDGLSPTGQLRMISDVVRPMRAQAASIWDDELKPALAKADIQIVDLDDLTQAEAEWLGGKFRREVFPLLTPLMLEPAITFPFISNGSLNIAVRLADPNGDRWARVKVPTVVPRLVDLPQSEGRFVLLEDLIQFFLTELFAGVKVKESHVFRVVRDADIEIRELESADLIDAIEKTLRLRRYGDPVLLEVEKSMPAACRKILMRGLELDPNDVVTVDGRIGMEFLWEMARLERPDLKFPRHVPFLRQDLATAKGVFEAVTKQDLLLHHPYDSFTPVQALVAAAATDPDVIGIKQTLYRVGAESPVVESLLEGAEMGKQVAAMVELKARFDESNNLVWSRALERAGVHVTYGRLDLKVHCKLCLLVRNEKDGIRTYVHIGTGNYNPSTAKLYTDLGLVTCDEDICKDVTELFNYLTGFSRQTEYRKLLVAPFGLREGILDRIDREITSHRKNGTGEIIFKLNSLVDPEVIDKLYEASSSGVKVDLAIRGICCLRPGVPGLSENIRVVSVVGQFLEHSRIYYFANGGQPEALLGSADMMRRNLDRRVEVLVPVANPEIIAYLHDEVLLRAMADTSNGWAGQPDGTYEPPAQSGRSSQTELMARPATKLLA